MLKNQNNSPFRSGVVSAIPILAELYRVQSRYQARLGNGIDPRSVVKMVAKLDAGKRIR